MIPGFLDELLIGYGMVATASGTAGAIVKATASDSEYASEREKRKRRTGSRMIALSPVWPIGLVWLAGVLGLKVGRGFRSAVKDAEIMLPHQRRALERKQAAEELIREQERREREYGKPCDAAIRVLYTGDHKTLEDLDTWVKCEQKVGGTYNYDRVTAQHTHVATLRGHRVAWERDAPFIEIDTNERERIREQKANALIDKRKREEAQYLEDRKALMGKREIERAMELDLLARDVAEVSHVGDLVRKNSDGSIDIDQFIDDEKRRYLDQHRVETTDERRARELGVSVEAYRRYMDRRKY